MIRPKSTNDRREHARRGGDRLYNVVLLTVASRKPRNRARDARFEKIVASLAAKENGKQVGEIDLNRLFAVAAAALRRRVFKLTRADPIYHLLVCQADECRLPAVARCE